MDSSFSALEQDPFGADADARYVYLNARQEELLVALTSAIADGGTRLLVTGGEGSGKSAFLSKLAEVLYTSCDAALLGHEMVFSCQRNTPLEAIEAALLEHAVLREGASENTQAAVLLLDDADRLDPAVLASLWRRWPSLNQGWSSVSVVMSAMPQPKRPRGRNEHNAMAAEQTFDLPPMTLADVEGLIRHRLQVAGLSDWQLFTPDAIERIAYFSKRVPGRIVQLCKYILAKVEQDLSVPVSGDGVKDAAYELFLPGHLQKLARGLASQPKAAQTTYPAPPEDVHAWGSGRAGMKNDDDAAHNDIVPKYEDSGRISMPPPPAGPTASAASAAARLPQRRRQHRRFPWGARSLVAAGAVLLLVVATVVAVNVRQTHHLERNSFEAVLVSPDDTPGDVQTEQPSGAGKDSTAGFEASPDREPDSPARPTASAVDLPEPTRSADRSTERVRAVDTEGADDALPLSAAEVADEPADEPLARVEPRRPPGLSELNNVALLQSELNALGYAAGPIDGIIGPRTRAAIRRFQAATGLPIDGRMSDPLIASVRRQAAKSNLQNQGRERPRRRIMPAIRGQLDSVQSPQEFLEYCRDNQDTWVFDRGTGKFVFCAHVVKKP